MQEQIRVTQYRFVDRLAVGGMAEVFVAIAQGATGFEKPVVIKRLLPQLAETARFQQMFLDEARILASLQHGNIVQILDMGTLDDLPFLALEYVDGHDLRSMLDRGAKKKIAVPYGVTAYIGSEVCRALDYAHRKQDDQGNPLGIVHRDINPANVFLSHEGVVKVGDFGLAKALGKIEQSETGIIKGKISYLSPEQSEGVQLDHRSDIFSLGTTLYEATCGRRPFVGSTEAEIIDRIRAGRYVMPSRIRPDFPPRLEAVIAKAMQREPQRRYETAAQMRSALLRFLQHLPQPMDDRRLSDLIAEMFGKKRRSKSFLIRLPPADALPPPMVSVPHPGPFGEYRHEGGPPPRVPAAPPSRPPAAPSTGSIPVIEDARSEGPLGPGDATGPPPPPPAMALGPRPATRTGPQSATRRQSRQGTSRSIWAGVILLLLAALGAVTYLIYRAYSPSVATLELESEPSGARVIVDGNYIGKKTPAIIERLRVGRDYLVTLQHPQATEITRRFRLREPRVYSHRFELLPLEQELKLRSDPEHADVRIDGELRGQTPLSVRLQRGRKYSVALHKTGYSSKVIQHYPGRGPATLEIVLEPEAQKAAAKRASKPRRGRSVRAIAPGKGVLELDVREPAKVYIDGRYAGTTPRFRRSMAPGTYTIKIVPKRSKIEHRGQTTITEGKIQRIHLTPPPVQP